MPTPITIVGNLTADPDLRFTSSGMALANMTVAVSDRKQNKTTNEWEDGVTTFYRCTAFRKMAENVAETLERGMSVIVYGRIEQESYETKGGEKRTDFKVLVDNIGPSLKNATAKVTKLSREAGNSNVTRQQGNDPWGAQGDDPWASAPIGKSDDIPPF